MRQHLIETCHCGQRNRIPFTVPAGKTLQCGACHAELTDWRTADDDDENDAVDDEDGQ